MDDALALEALLEISRKLNSQERCQVADKKFPLLDNSTVESAMGSVAYILENKPKWRKPCTNLVKKWCDVRDVGVSCKHVSWMTDSSLANTDCLLAVCGTLVEPNSASNLLSLDVHQQQAICLSVLRLADKSEKARNLTRKLFYMITDHPQATSNHLDFLCEIWKFRELLELSTKDLEVLVLKCPVGLEEQLLDHATNCMRKNDQVGVEPFISETEISSLTQLCVSSPLIFQVATSILLLLVQKSEAQHNSVNILINFVQRCTTNENNVVKLFPAKCQVALALLNVYPEETDCDSYVGYLIEALRELPSSVATLLIIINQKWLPLLVDKL